MKAGMLKKLSSKIILAIAFIFASVTDSSAFPALLDKRENGEISLTFYIVAGIIVLIGIVIAIVTSREQNTEETRI